VNMTPSLDRYRRGDLSSVRSDAPDPIPGWAEHAEAHAHDLRSVRLGDNLLASFGYMLRSRTEADGFAVVDRAMAKGVGRQLALLVRLRQVQWMQEAGLTTAWADCPASDRPAIAFLRAIGYKRIPSDDPSQALFRMEHTHHG